jgi:hypothetical protein
MASSIRDPRPALPTAAAAPAMVQTVERLAKAHTRLALDQAPLMAQMDPASKALAHQGEIISNRHKVSPLPDTLQAMEME